MNRSTRWVLVFLTLLLPMSGCGRSSSGLTEKLGPFDNTDRAEYLVQLQTAREKWQAQSISSYTLRTTVVDESIFDLDHVLRYTMTITVQNNVVIGFDCVAEHAGDCRMAGDPSLFIVERLFAMSEAQVDDWPEAAFSYDETYGFLHRLTLRAGGYGTDFRILSFVPASAP